uniref:NADH-ubiquinone oxidoreductase chain 2 n=1 Tax=Iphisa elegans TaxID=88863 RepID=A0A6M8Y6M4_IPHEL|nr:NADH dehydrogenase subunit 2 [Iphisa elegans]QKK36728.1 NADH dehydrogenase subunit 2 [Iphisa elegans]
MSPLILIILATTLTIGTTMTLNSSHWLLAWIGLEINMLAIVPLISMTHHPRATEATTKYFLAQAGASMLMLFSSTTNAWHTGTWDILLLTNPPACTMLTIALCMKIGLAPMHVWLPEVMQGTTLMMNLVLATWQKLAPMSLLIMTMNSHPKLLVIMLAATSIVVGGWGGLNQTQTRKILAYSSIANLGWMMIIITLMPKLTTMTLILYILMVSTLITSLMPQDMKTIKNISTTWAISPPLTTIIMLTLTSMGGLPPLSGFMPKWLILEGLMENKLIYLATMMAMATLLSLFFYLRLFYSSTLTISPNLTATEHKWRQTLSNTTPTTIFTLPTLTLIPLMPLMLM